MSKDISLGDATLAYGNAARLTESLGEALGISVDSAAASLEAFSLGSHYCPKAKGNGEVLGGASSFFALAQSEADSNMTNQLRNFISGLLLILLLSPILLLLFLFFFGFTSVGR